MADRKLDERLKALYDKGANVYSYSKLGSIHDCAYGAYLTYIKKSRGIHNIYDICGSILHDTLEKIMNNEAAEEDLKHALDSELEELDMVGIDFPRDKKGGTAIRERWINNMNCFCRDFVKPKGEFKTEQLLILKLNDSRYLQGYADLVKYYSDGSVQVLDWKSSSLYASKDLIPHGRQLTAYSLALEQMGFKVRDPAWIFLKYCKVQYFGKLSARSKRETNISKVCDRCRLSQTIRDSVIDKMKIAGYSDLIIDSAITRLEETNDINMLPDDIKNQFRVSTYVCKYSLSDDVRRECIEYINTTADKFEQMQQTGEWPPMKIDKGSEFFCINLCSHRKQCPYLRDYLNKSSAISTSDGDDLF